MGVDLVFLAGVRRSVDAGFSSDVLCAGNSRAYSALQWDLALAMYSYYLRRDPNTYYVSRRVANLEKVLHSRQLRN